jgi:transcriptional regulator with XRE-family HTH domain
MSKDKIENIIKQTCKELEVTQKRLAEIMEVSEQTISQWARGVIPTPRWAIKMFGLLKIERDYNRLKSLLRD